LENYFFDCKCIECQRGEDFSDPRIDSVPKNDIKAMVDVLSNPTIKERSKFKLRGELSEMAMRTKDFSLVVTALFDESTGELFGKAYIPLITCFTRCMLVASSLVELNRLEEARKVFVEGSRVAKIYFGTADVSYKKIQRHLIDIDHFSAKGN